MHLQMLEPRWTSPEAKEFAEYLQGEIAKVMTPPTVLVRAGPRAIAQHQVDAMVRTELMRRQLARLTETCSRPPQMVVSASNLIPER